MVREEPPGSGDASTGPEPTSLCATKRANSRRLGADAPFHTQGVNWFPAPSGGPHCGPLVPLCPMGSVTITSHRTCFLLTLKTSAASRGGSPGCQVGALGPTECPGTSGTAPLRVIVFCLLGGSWPVSAFPHTCSVGPSPSLQGGRCWSLNPSALFSVCHPMASRSQGLGNNLVLTGEVRTEGRCTARVPP